MNARRRLAAWVALLGFCLGQNILLGCGGSFTVGRIEPLLAVMVSPSEGATGIPLSSNISVTFSHDIIDPATLAMLAHYTHRVSEGHEVADALDGPPSRAQFEHNQRQRRA